MGWFAGPRAAWGGGGLVVAAEHYLAFFWCAHATPWLLLLYCVVIDVAAAVADLEAQAAEEAARDASLAPPGLPSAGHVPALMGPAVLMGAPIRPPGYHPPAGVYDSGCCIEHC